ncbi:MAG: hypothetical protein RI637_03580, partial [Acidimicrobiia bacterium]|nr:hypothetical protein [Acidimicrobiia bacterium]
SVNGAVEYSSPSFSARLDAGSFELLEATVGDSSVGGRALSLSPAADMFVLLRGLQGSMGHLPVVGQGAGTMVAHPGYA